MFTICFDVLIERRGGGGVKSRVNCTRFPFAEVPVSSLVKFIFQLVVFDRLCCFPLGVYISTYTYIYIYIK